MDRPARMAALATLHCLIGCAIGEAIGLTIGIHAGFSTFWTIALAATLSFVSGYAASTLPLIRTGMSFLPALRLVFIADTLSIATMTFIDNLMMLTIPGAMDRDVAQPIYWISRGIALSAAFIVAFPLNYWLLKRGKGHALTHAHMHDHHNHM